MGLAVRAWRRDCPARWSSPAAPPAPPQAGRSYPAECAATTGLRSALWGEDSARSLGGRNPNAQESAPQLSGQQSMPPPQLSRPYPAPLLAVGAGKSRKSNRALEERRWGRTPERWAGGRTLLGGQGWGLLQCLASNTASSTPSTHGPPTIHPPSTIHQPASHLSIHLTAI